ncbi:GspH/FimT family pseudopilin [Allosphingosinicella indica]|uniref:Type II secretion system protein H n=1 Tax=Allosphingosinicella indica TaxID=941907 RepID=A0A1X7H264_9SPHN|nr:GspH/FimT family pseudopilin [Allosphingosinicella indica]SMF77985.1 general secretion pathway protein H [Allosphingosinicella indica]
MPTSATGAADRAFCSHSDGFTLVELLIVLTIIAIVSTAVVLAIPGDRSHLIGEAERFAARAKAVQDRAVIDARATSIRVTASGYGFDQRGPGGWQPLGGVPVTEVPWDGGTLAAVAPGQEARIVFDATGIVEPARVLLRRGDSEAAIDVAYDGKIHVVR